MSALIEPVIEYLDNDRVIGGDCNTCTSKHSPGTKTIRLGRRDREPPHHGSSMIITLCESCRDLLYQLLRRNP